MIAYAIDNETTIDRDDAIGIETHENELTLHVFVANSSSVHWDAITESRAFLRAKTNYGVKQTTHMLPDWVVQKMSLDEGKQQAIQISLRYKSDDLSEPTNVEVKIGSEVEIAVLKYSDIEKKISENPDLNLLKDFSLKRLEHRRSTGALAIYDIIKGYGVNEEGVIVQLADVEKNIGYVIVQECMIAVNNAIAKWANEKQIPFLYRVHKYKEGEDLSPRVAFIQNTLKENLGQSWEDMQIKLANFSDEIGKAVYTPYQDKHVGLQLDAYCHFTSPIRRYGDLINQRQIISFLKKGTTSYNLGDLDIIAFWLNNVEEAKSKTYGRIDREKTRERITKAENNEINMISMKSYDFKKMLQVAIKTDKPIPVPILEAFSERVKRNKIKTSDVVFLCFESKHGESQYAKEWIERNDINVNEFTHLAQEKKYIDGDFEIQNVIITMTSPQYVGLKLVHPVMGEYEIKTDVHKCLTKKEAITTAKKILISQWIDKRIS